MAYFQARAAHQLVECSCCCNDEVLEEDMDTCTNPETKHKFCNNCIRRWALTYRVYSWGTEYLSTSGSFYDQTQEYLICCTH